MRGEKEGQVDILTLNRMVRCNNSLLVVLKREKCMLECRISHPRYNHHLPIRIGKLKIKFSIRALEHPTLTKTKILMIISTYVRRQNTISISQRRQGTATTQTYK